MSAVIIEQGYVKVDGVSVDLELIQSQADLLYRAWMLGGCNVTASGLASFIEVVASYRGWDIGIND